MRWRIPLTAEQLFREALDIHRRTVGERHPNYANTMNNLSTPLREQGRLEEAQKAVEDALRIVRPLLPDTHPRVLIYRLNLARLQVMRGEPIKAEPSLRQVLDERRRLYPAGDWRIGQAQSVLGGSLVAQGRFAEAEPLLLEAAAVLKPIPGAQGREAQANRTRLDALYAASPDRRNTAAARRAQR